MAEKLNIQPEAQKNSPESQKSAPEHHQAKEHEPKSHENSKQEQQERLTSSREAIEKQARTSEDIGRHDIGSERNHTATPPPTRELQAMAKDRLLRAVQRELPAPQRVLSKFVHAKPVEVVSAAGEKTIARPYGLLGGGLAAFVGSALTFYMAKHYGFKYNLFLFFTFFIAGYVIATVLEVIIRTVKHSSR